MVDLVPENGRLCCHEFVGSMLGVFASGNDFTGSEDYDEDTHGDGDDLVEGGYLVSSHAAVVRSLGA